MAMPRTTQYDLPLLGIVLALLAIGLAMVYSASGIRALDTRDDPSYFLVQQSVWAAIGLVGLLAAARVEHRHYRKAALPLVVLVVALLAAVLVPGIGTTAGGASRWLRLTSFIGLQPAELAKLALILYLAFWLGSRRDRVGTAAVMIPFAAFVALIAGLVVAEPDLGTAIVIIAIGLAVYFAAGARSAMRVPRKARARKRKITVRVPRTPSSFPITAKIESVYGAGRNPNFSLPAPSPSPNGPPSASP